MKKIYYIWAAGFIAIVLGMATLGVWGLSDTTSLILALGLGVILIASIFWVAAASKKSLAISINKLRETSPNRAAQVCGAYNAYHHEGERFKTIMSGEPAILDFDKELITIKVLSGHDEEKTFCYPKEQTEILWVGNSGRLKDYTTWILIRGNHTSSLISAFAGTYIESTEGYTEDLYFKLSEDGYKTNIDQTKRGIVRQCILILALFGVGVESILNKSWAIGLASIAASIICLVIELRPHKGPKRKMDNPRVVR